MHVVLLREDLLSAAAQRLDFTLLNVLTALKRLDPRVDVEALLPLLSRHFSYSD